MQLVETNKVVKLQLKKHLLKTAITFYGNGSKLPKRKLHMGLNCTEPKLHEGTKLQEKTKIHEDNFARRINFAREKKN